MAGRPPPAAEARSRMCGTVSRRRRRREAGDFRCGGSSRRETRTDCAQSATPPTVSNKLVNGPPRTGATTKQLIDPAAGTNCRQLAGAQRRSRSASGSKPPPYRGSGVSTSMNSIARSSLLSRGRQLEGNNLRPPDERLCRTQPRPARARPAGGRGKQLIARTPPPQKGCSAQGAMATLNSAQLDDSAASSDH
jgi:hypothetical protein